VKHLQQFSDNIRVAQLLQADIAVAETSTQTGTFMIYEKNYEAIAPSALAS